MLLWPICVSGAPEYHIQCFPQSIIPNIYSSTGRGGPRLRWTNASGRRQYQRMSGAEKAEVLNKVASSGLPKRR